MTPPEAARVPVAATEGSSRAGHSAWLVLAAVRARPCAYGIRPGKQLAPALSRLLAAGDDHSGELLRGTVAEPLNQGADQVLTSLQQLVLRHPVGQPLR